MNARVGTLSATAGCTKGTISNEVPCHTRWMPKPADFTFVRRKNGEVVISHRGRRATVLRGRQADRFLARVTEANAQDVMARATGNYKRGNERRRQSGN